ncbi:MAG TPA: hypothetical protein DHW71_09805 [Gammaproteobacteria bacterium]|nr:hypothetical protein [Gammaproteobacteria bacterium]HBF07835.1 hypothetical protein [Gammaproteobacteria bacterium]HCK93271.1 hypothetical protein [Gammaproteobacteria bacterium]|tara:strand:- start:15547 stop:15957 length:411 start_codon:yes stop_codon:yes gene_type:complete
MTRATSSTLAPADSFSSQTPLLGNKQQSTLDAILTQPGKRDRIKALINSKLEKMSKPSSSDNLSKVEPYDPITDFSISDEDAKAIFIKQNEQRNFDIVSDPHYGNSCSYSQISISNAEAGLIFDQERAQAKAKQNL